MRRRVLYLFLLLAIGLLSGQTFPEARPNLVFVDVQAYNKTTNAYISDLSKEDFEITDNGVHQEIVSFDFRTAPLDLALLMDVSGSMMDIPRQVALGAVPALRYLGPEDRVAVLSFSSGCRVELDLIGDRDQIVKAIETAAGRISLERESNTRLYDALARGLQLFDARREPNLRRALVAVTDDREQKSKVRLETLIKAAREKDVTVSALIRRENPLYRGGPPGPWPPPPEPPKPPILFPRPRIPVDAGQRSMERLVEATGGEYLHPRTKGDALIVTLDRVRARYLLGYVLPEPQRKSGVHRVRVRLSERASKTHPDILLRVRSGHTY